MPTSCAPSSPQSQDSPKELLLVLSILNEKQKVKHEQRQEEEMQQQQQNQQQQQYQHLHNRHQHHDQKQHKQQQLQESKWKGEQKQSQQRMELSQIEFIYRAEGNANLVLALPQFKKVLRLPKISKNSIQKQLEQKTTGQETQCYQKSSPECEQPQGQQKKQEEFTKQEHSKATGQQENEIDAVGIPTMDHYVAYISIIRCLVGNEFVFEADIVAVPNPTDRHWINEHIRPHRPANRLDKEFGGHFGLLLPDATQLPAEFDILFPNLQCKNQSTTVTTATKTSHCSNSSINTDKSCSKSNNIFGADTFAIEIKPKQGWLLPNDVNNLFDIKPKIIQRARTTQPPSLRETKTALKAAVATTISTTTAAKAESDPKAKALKTSADTECFTATQNEPSQTMGSATSTATPTATATTALKNERSRTTTASQTASATTSDCCNDNMRKTNTTPRIGKISHSLYDNVDSRCRYCCMQFLKMKQQKILKRNQYCPLDLFSGSAEKMLHAVQALFDCPQNNLRIFKNGQLVFDDQISRKSQVEDLFSSDKLQLIKHLLVTCLLREYENEGEAKNQRKEQFNKDIKQQPLPYTDSTPDVGGVQSAESREGSGDDADRVDADAGVAAVGQPHSSVTSCKKQKLSTMPKTITTITTSLTETEVTKVKSTSTSAAPIVSMANTLTSTSNYNTRCLEQINKAEVTCLPKNCVLQKILHLQSLAKTHFQFMLDHEYADKKEKTYSIVCKLLEKFSKNHNELTLCQLSPEEQYILAATALDCSIMITFCEIENVLKDKSEEAGRSLIDSPYVVSILGRAFLTKITLLDLDPKSDAHFYKYCLQTKQIFDAMDES